MQRSGRPVIRTPAIPTTRRAAVLTTALALLGAFHSAHAIDNPDAPDRTAEFLARAKPLEDRIGEAAAGGPALAQANADYAQFLDAELNQAYTQLLAQLKPADHLALTLAQRRWLQFRDAEGRFIDHNWTAQNFGSSATLSRAGYRAALVRQRVLSLLAYLQNY